MAWKDVSNFAESKVMRREGGEEHPWPRPGVKSISSRVLPTVLSLAVFYSVIVVENATGATEMTRARGSGTLGEVLPRGACGPLMKRKRELGRAEGSDSLSGGDTKPLYYVSTCASSRVSGT